MKSSVLDTYDQIAEMTLGYLEAVAFTECTSDRPELREARLSNSARSSAERDCREFFHLNGSLLQEAVQCPGYGWTQAGIDLWFTRNRHGAGFWDRDDLPEILRQALTGAAHQMSSVEACLGEDGQLHLDSENEADNTRPIVWVLMLRMDAKGLEEAGLQPRQDVSVLHVFDSETCAMDAAKNLAREIVSTFQSEVPALRDLRVVVGPERVSVVHERLGHLALLRAHGRERVAAL